MFHQQCCVLHEVSLLGYVEQLFCQKVFGYTRQQEQHGCDTVLEQSCLFIRDACQLFVGDQLFFNLRVQFQI